MLNDITVSCNVKYVPYNHNNTWHHATFFSEFTPPVTYTFSMTSRYIHIDDYLPKQCQCQNDYCSPLPLNISDTIP